MRLLLRVGRGALCAAVIGSATPSCYTAGQGTPPPIDSFYYPTGLAVSAGGNVLYAANSDFDLQWNGGTLQSYDLFKLRQDTARLIQANLSGAAAPPSGIPFLTPWQPNCLSTPAAVYGSGYGVELQQGCAPPVDSTQYVRDAAIIGAFAEDLQLSGSVFEQYPPGITPPTASQMEVRLLAPVAGNATITYADIAYDDPNGSPPTGDGSTFAPFQLSCPLAPARTENRCGSSYQVGSDPNAPGDTRNATLPGEPFGLAQTQDGTALAVTSQTQSETSLLTSGIGPSYYSGGPPIMQFNLEGVPTSSVGITAIPHDPYAVRRCEDVGDAQPCISQAFLQTTNTGNTVDLLRYYDDDGSSLHRPYLTLERSTNVNTVSTTDFRGIAIDPTLRLQCEAAPGADMVACGRLPARVYIATRTLPSALLYGTIGAYTSPGVYDPDYLELEGVVPLQNYGAPSKVYLAPVIQQSPSNPNEGVYSLRVFVVMFNSNQIAVIDPGPNGSTPSVEGLIPTGQGPFAMAFDPFSWEDVATGATVPIDSRQPADLALRRYRFAYVGVFTSSYMQVVDLDQLATQGMTYENVVFNFGAPQIPIGQSQ